MIKFGWFISKKIALSKSNKNLSKIIIRIGQIAVILGIAVSIITFSIGVGSKKAIKQKMSDFNGHIVVKPYSTNNSFNSTPLDIDSVNLDFIKTNSNITHYQYFAEMSGVIRTPQSFDGVVAKGYADNYDIKVFSEFMRQGTMPIYKADEISNEIMLSEKIANRLNLNIGDPFTMYFVREGKNPLYRKFLLTGIFSTEIKDIDNNYMICDLKQIQKINNWSPHTIGGIELFVPDIEKVDQDLVSLHPQEHYKLSFVSATQRFSNISEWVDLFDNNINTIMAIMLVVVFINMMMVLLILIIERTYFIGIMKTLGASNALLRSIFIQYALIIMVPGIIIGNVLALSFLLIQKYFHVLKLDPENYYLSEVPVYMSPVYIIIISISAFLMAGLLMILPSLAIKNISPIQAIKFD